MLARSSLRLSALAHTLRTKGWRGLRRYVAGKSKPLLDLFSLHAASLRRVLLRRTTFIAITGSCGKSTATKLTRAVLSEDGDSVMGDDNNSERAAIRAVLTLPPATRFCVQEVGADGPGSIARRVKILRPQIGIVTTIGSDHYKAFRTLEETAKEKGKLVESLPATGTAILNADDPHVRAMASRTQARVVTFGLSPEADIRALDISSAWPDRLALTVAYGDKRVRVQTRLPGGHWIASVLAAIACGLTRGLDLETCARAIEQVEPVFGRYSVHQVPAGPVFVLDSNKASLWTIASSFAFLESANAARKTVIIGTISDYPGSASQRYRRVARDALEVADRVAFVGPHSAYVDKLRRGEHRDRLFTFMTSFQASQFLAHESVAGELILIKASGNDHLERIALSQFDDVVCWRERCGKGPACPHCRQYQTSSPPPFGFGGMAESYEPAAPDLLRQTAKAPSTL